MLLAAVGGAGVVAAARRHALVAPFLADEEGEGLRVLGHVGAEAVAAFAVVGQIGGVAVVRVGGGGFGGGLQADELGWGVRGWRMGLGVVELEDLQDIV